MVVSCSKDRIVDTRNAVGKIASNYITEAKYTRWKWHTGRENAMKRIFTVVGARPQFIKAAAVNRALVKSDKLAESIIHTGQHYDDNMSDVFFRELGIGRPKYHLALGGGTQGAMTGQMIEAIEKILIDDRPDAVLVYGDTNSTTAGAMAAVKLHIPVAHVEAGLRSFNRKMPEEINRIVADVVSDVLLCPTSVSVENLRREGVTRNVHLVGDVMFDATLNAIEMAKMQSRVVERLGLVNRNYAVCTLHRAENTNDPERFDAIITYLQMQAREREIIFPVHPRTANLLRRLNRTIAGVRIIEPLGYIDMNALMADCELVMTDSGGLQKEAYFHGKPCITLRDETEWVELIEAGWNRLWTAPDWAGPRRSISDYGFGHAADQIVKHLEDLV
jgi:UDP-GlcNAc3NAcA epimerase